MCTPSRFQFTPLREGRRTRFSFVKSGYLFQFTPLREGRPFYEGSMHKVYTISIHAPPRGATRNASLSMIVLAISIHAPPRGATVAVFARLVVVLISIHAPPRGATGWTRCPPGERVFQFTPLREGRRNEKSDEFVDEVDFNSRPSARGDDVVLRLCPEAGKFQFTPLREGRPMFQRRDTLHKRISIHAPPRGATAMQKYADNFGKISIHAPPRGATGSRVRKTSSLSIFQFTPLREGRLKSLLTMQGLSDFNSRPSARGDMTGCIPSKARIFQFTPLREGRHAFGVYNKKPLPFQFTPLREGRPNVAIAFALTLDISIHAPPRGATSGHPLRRQAALYFNSRPSARGDRRSAGGHGFF